MSVRLRIVVIFSLLMAAWSVTAAQPASAFGSSEPPPLPAVSTGGYMTCAVQTSGLAACWGENGVPANDAANTSPGGGATPPAGLRFLEVNAGYATTCGVTTTNTVACWGSGRFGKFMVPSGTFTTVAPGLNYICGLRTGGTITCWGGDDPAVDPAQQVVANVPAGTFTQVSVGIRHACALRTEGTIACWGVNADGQTNAPAGTYSDVNVGNFTSCALRTEDGSPVCWGRNQGGQQTYPAGETYTQITVGFAHVCGLRSGGTASCWGRSSEGQTVVPAGTYTQVSAGTFNTCAMPTEGPPARCWGNNAAGRTQPSMRAIQPQQGYVANPYTFPIRMATYVSPTPDFSVTAGSVPPGLTLSPTGLLSGTPTEAGSFTFTVAASSLGLSPTDCANPGGGDLSCTPGDPNSIATATRVFTVAIGAVAPDPGSIAGRVTAASGPVVGAPITVLTSGGAPAGETSTDASGDYRVDVLPGDYTVTASGPELQPQTTPATVTSNQTTTVDFALVPLVRPTVVGVFNNHFETVTDGLFVQWSETFEQRLDQPSGYTIHQQADCADTAVATAFRGNWLATRPTIRDLEMTGWENIVPGGTYFLRVAPETEFGLVSRQRNNLQCVQFVSELRTVDRATVAGVVTNSTGGAVSGATVTVTRTLREPGSVAGGTTTDGTGGYSVANLPPGPYNLTVAAPGYYSQTRGVALTGGATLTADFVLRALPVAGDDAYTQYGSDTALVIPAAGLLANDTDLDNDALTAGLVTGPVLGSLVLSPDGSFVYQPDEDQVGSVSFTYRSSDGTGSSNTATVTITVAPGCRGTAATIVGTSGRDRLVGTSGVDVIAGLGGPDTINGLGGDDVICGGSGRDAVNAGGGNDYADGGSGNDNLEGGAGEDTLVGNGGSDAVIGGDGDDVLSGGTGTNDRCRGGSGIDSLAPVDGCETVANVP